MPIVRKVKVIGDTTCLGSVRPWLPEHQESESRESKGIIFSPDIAPEGNLNNQHSLIVFCVKF